MRLLMIGVMLGWFLSSPSESILQQTSGGDLNRKIQEEISLLKAQIKEARSMQIQTAVNKPAQAVRTATVENTPKRVSPSVPARSVAKPSCTPRPPDRFGNLDYFSCSRI